MQFDVEARFYEKLPDGKIRCQVCPRACIVGEGERGHCGVRENRGGTYYLLVHSRVCAAHVDPVEKKPLFHFLPGTTVFSIATAGCNVHCKFCQNWDISQSRPEKIPAEYVPPELVSEWAAHYGCPAIAYTYSEPVVFSEFIMDCAEAGHAAGIRSLAVSNGYIQPKALRAVYGRMDAVKIDLKSFSDSFYSKIVGGRLKPVLDSIVTLREMGKWVEIVYLVIPTLNDSEDQFRGLAQWAKGNVGAEVPIHFTQFHPDYLLKDLPVTPVATLERAREMALAEGLHYVYIGNVPGHAAEHTYCPGCGRVVVERNGMRLQKMSIRKGACAFCNHPIPGIWHA
jgi:pyruvate formate lyase activating enzyme